MAITVNVRNFQSIQTATVVIDKLTVVTGSNNHGKSALQRAIRGVFQNTPGTAFVRHGEDACSVEIKFGDGNSVEWCKGPKTKPTYTINGTLIHPGKEVPDEVKALGVLPILAGGREHWPSIAPQIVGQMFLIDQPGSALAEAVADVDRVGHLNRAMKVSETDRRRAEEKLRVRKEDLQTADKDLAYFDGLDDAKLLVSAVETAWTVADRVHRALVALHLMDDRHKAALVNVRRFEGIGSVVVPEGDDLKELTSESEALTRLCDRLVVASRGVTVLGGVSLVGVPVLDDTLKSTLEDLEALRMLADSVKENSSDIDKIEDVLKTLAKELGGVDGTLEGILIEMGECPTCGKVQVGSP